MEQNTVLAKKENIYTQYLQGISGIKFTAREIDIISSIIHRRSDKKIAALLYISPRTVGAHNRNIMTKLGCNSKEAIIDFIENSGKLLFIRQYYLSLLAQNCFEKYLQKLAALNKQEVICIVNDITNNTNQELIKNFKRLQNDLKLANILLKINEPVDVEHKKYISIFISKQDHTDCDLINLRSQDCMKTPKVIIENPINFSQNQSYYFSVFDLIQKTTNNLKVTILKEQFTKEIEAFISEEKYITTKHIEINEIIGEERNHIKSEALSRLNISLVFLIITLCIVGIIYFNNTKVNFMGHKQQQSIRSDLIVPNEKILLERPEIINEMTKLLTMPKDSIKAIALTGIVGIGGAGKTTLARYYGKFISDASVIWELNAEKKESLLNSFQNLAIALAQNTQRKEEIKHILDIQNLEQKEQLLLPLIRNWLKEEQNWLLIYDNVENVSLIKDYFPQDKTVWGCGKVIITTRDDNIQNTEYITHNDIIKIEALTDDQKLILFSKIFYKRLPSKLTQSEKKYTTDFLKSIPPFPLDVASAASYLQSTNTSFSQYIKNIEHPNVGFENVQKTLLNERGIYTKTRYSIITTSLQSIIDTNKEFTDLALFISLLDSQSIPKILLEHYKDNTIVDDFMLNLKKYSFITSESTSILGPTFSIHRSTQAIILAYLKAQSNLEKNTGPLFRISSSLEDYMNDLLHEEDHDKSTFLLDHYEHFLTHSVLTDQITGSLKSVLGSTYCYLEYSNLKAKQLLEKSIESLKKHGHKNSDKMALALTHLGIVNDYLGNDKKGEDLLRQGVAIYQKNQVNNIGLAKALAYLGQKSSMQGDYYSAEKFLKQSIGIYQEHLGSSNGLARAIRYLGVLYRELGDYRKAVENLEKSVSLYDTKALPIDAVFSMTYLGSVYGELGNYKKAQELLWKSLILSKEYDSEKHNPYNIAWVKWHLGIIYSMLGDYTNAEQLLKEGIEVYKQYYGEDNHDVAFMSVYLGDLDIELADYEKAKNIINHSLDIQKAHSYDTHPDIGMNLLYLGKVYCKLGEYNKAKALLEQSLAIYKSHYGDKHIQTARVLCVLGENELLIQENFDSAEIKLNIAKNILTEEKHPEVRIPMELLGNLYLKKAEISKNTHNIQEFENNKVRSISYLKQALEIATTTLPENSAHIVRLYKKLQTYYSNTL